MIRKKAFTLIELLVVIAIIGILATISVIALQNARAKSRDAKRAGDMKQIQTALELFFNDKNRYPTSTEWATGKIFSTSTSERLPICKSFPVLQLQSMETALLIKTPFLMSKPRMVILIIFLSVSVTPLVL